MHTENLLHAEVFLNDGRTYVKDLYTSLQCDFLIILEEILKRTRSFLVLDQLMVGQFRVEGDRIFKGILGCQHVVEIDIQTLLVN